MMGVLNVLKTPGITSHEVVSRLRRLTGIRRIGHGGTLDPQAAGVLPVCIEQATKMIPYMDHRQKTYRVEMILGVVTDTQDLTGRILARSDRLPEPEAVKTVLMSFIGPYRQIPPMYSAVKQQGKKLYDLARQGIEVERTPRLREIHEIRWIQMKEKALLFDVTCSEGTYVRTLCHDAGQRLGCGAAMGFLLRIRSCGLHVNDAITLEELENQHSWKESLLPVDQVLGHYPAVFLPETQGKQILNGGTVRLDEQGILKDEQASSSSGDREVEPVRVYLNGRFIGMGEAGLSGNTLKMKKQVKGATNHEGCGALSATEK